MKRKYCITSFLSQPTLVPERMLVPLVANELREATKTCRHVSLVLSGGRIAPRILRVFCKSLPENLELTVILSDERVTPDYLASNRSQLEEALSETKCAVRVLIAPSHVDGKSEQSAEQFSSVIKKVQHPSHAILGVGVDGHIASLFPGQEHDDTSIVTYVNDAPHPYTSRLSLSMPFLLSIPHRWVVIAGAEKRDVVERITTDESLPVRQVKPTRWFIDEAATQPCSAARRS